MWHTASSYGTSYRKLPFYTRSRLLVLVFYGYGYERATSMGMDIRILLHGHLVPMGISATNGGLRWQEEYVNSL